MVDNSFIFNKGTTGYKVIWKCDNKDCKYPDKVHSIQRCHLNKNRSAFCNEEIQICHPCQFTGKGNPRFGDRRGWDDFMEKEKSIKMREKYKNKFTGQNNPSKLDNVKIKKGQLIINYQNVYNYAKKLSFKLNNINGDNKGNYILV